MQNAFFTLTVHFNLDAKFSWESLYLGFIKFVVEKSRFTYSPGSAATGKFSNNGMEYLFLGLDVH